MQPDCTELSRSPGRGPEQRQLRCCSRSVAFTFHTSMTSPFGSSPPIGTHLFASHIVQDSSLSVFRQFAVLNARNLLYLQSELASLEAKILQLDERANDMTKGNDTWATPRSWRAMRNAGLKAESEASEGENGEMWKVALDVRRVLKEYST